MTQFSIKLPRNVLIPDSIASVRAFAERTDWAGLPSATSLYAGIIKVVLRPPGTDTSMAEEALLLLATQRLVLYLESSKRPSALDAQRYLSWLEAMEETTSTSRREDHDPLQLCKDKLQLSIELMTEANGLFKKDHRLAAVLHACANELAESAELQTRDSADERVQSALSIAELAARYSYDENSMQRSPSMWARIKAAMLGGDAGV